MKRTKLAERKLPRYTRGEEIANMVTHIVGGAMGIAVLTLCVIRAAIHHNPMGVVTSAIYGATMILLYTMSSVYHGLLPSTGKKVMQVIDHCTIYVLIAGTYTPIVLASIAPKYPPLGWTLFGVEWGLAALAITLTAIDLKKYNVFSMICYIGMGWAIIFFAKQAMQALTFPGFLLLLLGGISLLGTVFAPGFIWTQSFLSGDGGSMDTAAFMFRFFAIQILFYGLGSVFSGVLNAHRDYFWSTFAPVLNNVIVIASFMGFAPVSAQFGEQAGIILIAVGTTLGVFVQMACQIPALGKHGVHPHIHIDFKDPALRQTIALGIPTLLATVCMFVSTSITNAAALVVQPETGPSVIAYARLWYTLPYALIAASLSTALYTELSHDAQEKDYDSVRTGISRGVAQMFFFLIPFAMYLIVFARPLNMIYCAGKFDESGVALVSEFLIYLALSLPLYGVVVLMQKSFSALLDMKPYSRYCLYSAIGQAGSVLLFGVVLGYGMPAIALSYVVDYVVLVGCSLWWLRRRLHGLQVKSILHGGFFGLLFGGLGAAAGAGVMWALEHFVGALGSSILITLGYVCVAGVVSLAVTFGLAFVLKMPEVSALLRRK